MEQILTTTQRDTTCTTNYYYNSDVTTQNIQVEGPPSSRLQSKMKQQHTFPKQEQPECNPTPMDPPGCNPAEIEVNSIDIIPETYSWLRLTKLLSYAGKTIADPAPVSLP